MITSWSNDLKITTAVQSLNLGFKLMCLFKSVAHTQMDSILNSSTYSCKLVHMHIWICKQMLSSHTYVQGALHILCSAVPLCSIIIGKQMEHYNWEKLFPTGVKIREGLWLTWYTSQKVGIFFGRKLKNAKFWRFLSHRSCRSALVLIVLLFQCNSVLII